MSAPSGHVDRIRRFNRFWTGRVGLLRSGLLETPYSLTEARVIFELAQRPRTELADVRRHLGIDAGYLSRIISRFKTDGLVEAETSSEDRRRQVLRLTSRGREVFADLDARSSAEVVALLDPLSDEEQRRLVAAMETIEDLLGEGPSSPPYVIRPLRAGDLGWVVHRHGVVYAEEYGWDATFEGLVARIVAEYVDGLDPTRENAWIAEVDHVPVGCVFCVEKDDETAQLRLLLVEPRVRGLGIGSRLVEECIRFARGAGYVELMLWTNDVLVSARRIYEAFGFRLAEEEPHHSFGRDLVGQNWTLRLDEARPPR
jgi:DNA-binding MarR family transcriptional regulator/GNAT superfamily N-acetyltransferase